jgi:putative transposase
MDTLALPCDLTDAEWALLEPLLPQNTEGRPRVWPLRTVLNAIFYLLRSGCAWRLLPPHYPPWKTVYSTLRRWRIEGVWEDIHAVVRECLREAQGRQTCPSRAVLDSQSVKTTDKGGPAGLDTIGYDGYKKVRGRKRHLLTDSQGLVLWVAVTAANLPEREGARQMLEPLRTTFPRMRVLTADQGYTGPFGEWVQEHLGWEMEITRRPTEAEHRAAQWEIAKQRVREGASTTECWRGLSFTRPQFPGKGRWVIERTFAWLSKSRRLAKDYEFLPATSKTMVYLVMLRLMLARLAKRARPNELAVVCASG